MNLENLRRLLALTMESVTVSRRLHKNLTGSQFYPPERISRPMRLVNWKVLLLFPLMAGCAATVLMAQNLGSVEFSSGRAMPKPLCNAAQRMDMCLRLMQRLRSGSPSALRLPTAA